MMWLKPSAMQIVVCLMLLFHLAMTRAEPDSTSFEQAFNQARQLEHAGQTDQAIAAYDKLIANYPDQPEPYNNLAVLLATQGKLDDARDRLEKAIHINDIYATIYDNLSAVYVEMARGSYAKALQLGVTQRELALKDVDTKATPVTTTHSPVQTAESATPKQTIVALNNSSIQPASKPQSSQVAAAAVDPARQLDEIKLTLQGWASAWTAQEVDLYLSFYAPAFKPPAAQSRRSWEQLRSQRLRKPAWVKVTLDDIQIEESDAGQARVRFIQDYRSANYSDITHKEVLLQTSADGWQILAESAL